MIFLPHQKSILPQWITNLMGDSDESFPILWWVGTECTWNRHLLFKMNLNHDANKSLFNFILNDAAGSQLFNHWFTLTISIKREIPLSPPQPTIPFCPPFQRFWNVSIFTVKFRWRKWCGPLGGENEISHQNRRIFRFESCLEFTFG